MDQKMDRKKAGLRILLALFAGTLLSTKFIQWNSHPGLSKLSKRRLLRTGKLKRELNNNNYYQDGNSNNGSNNNSNNGSSNGNSGGGNYLWARDDDDDYYVDDDYGGNYWESNKEQKASNYISSSGGGGSSVQGNEANYDSQTFDDTVQNNYADATNNRDTDDEGINLGLLSSAQRTGLAFLLFFLMMMLLVCFLAGPYLIERFCYGLRSRGHQTETTWVNSFAELGNF